MRLTISALLTSLVLAGTSACASGYPTRPGGPVLDQAGIIPEVAENSLDVKLRRYFSNTCRAVVVATVSSLKGETVDSYATHLANKWKIGDPVRGDGVLLLVAPVERKVRIEVSRSLQSAMSDRAAADIIQGGMMERYRRGDYAEGVSQGIDAIMARLNEYASPNESCRPINEGSQ